MKDSQTMLLSALFIELAKEYKKAIKKPSKSPVVQKYLYKKRYLYLKVAQPFYSNTR
ncbi:hypothetical protein PARC_a0946 [Pseudoalteromonas arctica A 37-1-2]|uniref:Uncharacterized protein n=1 Tax=Pseudoalteromonas arctica A 37-1-2 TaxID=1117313 RepID=A0A290S277_9GAMM|nr:hypothetical protein PARC_a0946 [Pseudoalteromonas arctica A 37-1-2]